MNIQMNKIPQISRNRQDHVGFNDMSFVIKQAEK